MGIALTRHDLLAAEMVLVAPSMFSRNDGRGVGIYVLDTGCDNTHPDLWGRVELQDLFNLGNDHCDHGTHVAGLLVSSKVGIAPEAKVIMIKICNDHAQIDYGMVEIALEWISRNHNIRQKALINLNFKLTKRVMQLLSDCEKRGILAFVAAGNSNAYIPETDWGRSYLMVGSLRDRHNRADTSNYGGMVDIYAPGEGIMSCRPGGAYRSASGTSMAAPIACAVGALFLSRESLEPRALRQKILENCRMFNARRVVYFPYCVPV